MNPTHRKPGPPQEPAKEYRCKFCKVQVNSSYDKRPVLGKTHGKSCPR